MTARERWKRASGFARAGKRLADYAARVGWNPTDPGNYGNLQELSRHEAHAWARLPEAARRATVNPAEE